MVRWWNRFFREQDEIDIALDDLRKQGAGRARLAHFFASLLVVLFSAGSLVALGSDALNTVVGQWQADHTINIPSTITLAVTFFMVLAMDMSLIHAAGMLRVLAARRAGYGERWIHIAVMVVVSALESGTYGYMSWKFEHPVSLAAQVLITARALAAPLLAVYLSMAKPLPVTARDMLAYAELASGGGVLRDVVSAANNKAIDLPAFASKMKLYAASAVMIPEDSKRLQGMISAVVESAGPESPSRATREGSQSAGNGQSTFVTVESLEPSESPPDKPPTGPGSPVVRTADSSETVTTPTSTIRLVPERRKKVAARSRVRTPAKPANLEVVARQAYANGATTVRKMMLATGMSRNAAAGWVRTLKEGDSVRAQQAAQ